VPPSVEILAVYMQFISGSKCPLHYLGTTGHYSATILFSEPPREISFLSLLTHWARGRWNTVYTLLTYLLTGKNKEFRLHSSHELSELSQYYYDYYYYTGFRWLEQYGQRQRASSSSPTTQTWPSWHLFEPQGPRWVTSVTCSHHNPQSQARRANNLVTAAETRGKSMSKSDLYQALTCLRCLYSCKPISVN